MEKGNFRFFLGISMALALFALGHGGDAAADDQCRTVTGVADPKAGGGQGKAQYWINGFPGKSSNCLYTLELCFVGERNEIGSTVFMTAADGMKHKSTDNILNCNRGWSHFFDGAVAGAQEIMVGVKSGYPLNVRFSGKPLFMRAR